jgi:hypothetical protein
MDVALLEGKLVAAVASAGCKIVVDVMIIIIRRAMATGPISELRYWLVLYRRPFLINMDVLTPAALVLSNTKDKDRYGHLKTSPFSFSCSAISS